MPHLSGSKSKYVKPMFGAAARNMGFRYVRKQIPLLTGQGAEVYGFTPFDLISV